MKNIFNPAYRQDYLDGYTSGLNPYIDSIEDTTEAYAFGFEQGRVEYEQLNGRIIYGIPQLSVRN